MSEIFKNHKVNKSTISKVPNVIDFDLTWLGRRNVFQI